MLAAAWQSLSSQHSWDGKRLDQKRHGRAPWTPVGTAVQKRGIMYKKVALRHAGWHNRTPANESTHVNKKGK